MEKDLLLQKYGNLIKSCAQKFYNVPFEDLYQVGVIGLLKAYENYKANTTAQFSTYAYEYIFGEMYKLSTSYKPLKINKETLRLYKEIEKTREYLTHKLNRCPTNLDIALFMEINESDVDIAVSSSIKMLSLDESYVDSETPLYEIIKGPNVDFDNKIFVEDMVNNLPSPEKEIIISRYFKDMTQSEIAFNLGLTQVMVSRMEKKSLEVMKNYIAS